MPTLVLLDTLLLGTPDSNTHSSSSRSFKRVPFLNSALTSSVLRFSARQPFPGNCGILSERTQVLEGTGYFPGEGLLHSSISKFEAERAEVDAILSSGMLGRANNLVRLLTFVCEKHFEGATAEIKEYNIAVQALGRPHDFDPQVDTIVRVTAHALRKRLDDYYRTGGAEHTVRICLPPGGYVPKFTHRGEMGPENTRLKLEESDAAHA